MKIYHIPIEPYDRRYTRDWIQQFETEFGKADTDYVTILGEQTTAVLREDTVLDSCGTNYYKMSQLMQLFKLIQNNTIKDDDVIFFADLWFPGIEALFYIRNNEKVKFKVVGVLHAGTWDNYDFTYRNGMRPWGKFIEAGWFVGFDQVYVATHFHKDLIIEKCIDKGLDLYNKIKVTGIPFYANELRTKYPVTNKEDIVVFPHRIAPEKNPQMFDKLAKMFPQYKFVKTIDVTNSAKEYFELLAKSKVMISFAQQETFGYSTVEAMALGNLVIVPNMLSYRETVPPFDRYEWTDEQDILFQVSKQIMTYMSKQYPVYYDLDQWEQAIPNMIKELKKL
jgi:glycosyltransferase involved in cell wall biosynthesis